MKTDAICRIVIFSIVIVILLGILGVGLGFGLYAFDINTSIGSSQVIEGSQGSVPANEIRNLQIDWVDGDITIRTADTDTITFLESGYASDNDLMVWKQTGDTLTIRYSKRTIQIGFLSVPSKDLEIIVPEDWMCNSLDIDTVSGSVKVNNISTDDIDLDCTSAACYFVDCNSEDLTLTTVSGDLFYAGAFSTFACDGVSAECKVLLATPAEQIEMDSVSGDLILYLPDDGGFTASLASVSGNISTEFETIAQGDKQLYGDGSCYIEADTVSGSVTIKKADRLQYQVEH